MIKKLKKTLTNLTGHVGRKIIKRPNKTKMEGKKSAKAGTESNAPRAKVLMFGWELPPFNSGGLGVACYELAHSLAAKNTDITFVLPHRVDINVPFMKMAFAKNQSLQTDQNESIVCKRFSIKAIDSPLSPYLTADSYLDMLESARSSGNQAKILRENYGNDLIDEVYRYGEAAAEVAREEQFDIIHAHDWLSYLAGVKAKEISGKPLITHVHAIEYDRSQELAVNPAICAIEQEGLQKSDKIIAVSDYTRQRIHQFYHIPLSKIEVVYNGINIASKKLPKRMTLKSMKNGGKKMVLFVGRVTYQKGVDYFVEAASKALTINPNIVFMVVGSGDMMYQIIEQAAQLGISDKVFFPGFLRGNELENIYRAADLYVMPSVSEPFGLVALEALSNGVPVIVSNQSGASEVIRHSLKVDFWDTAELANKIVAVLKHTSLHKSLKLGGHKEAMACTWDLAADKCVKIYQSLATI